MVCYSLFQWTTFRQLSYWSWQKTKTKVHTATVWTSLNSAGTTQIWKKFCQQPGHMVSWVNTRLAGIETVKYCFNIYRRENSLPSKFYVVFLNPFLLLSLTLKKKKKKKGFSQESHFEYKNLYFFQLLLIINLECVLGLQYLFPTSTGRRWPGSCQEHQQKEHPVKTWVRGLRRHGRQQRLLLLSSRPRGQPSLGRWRLNVQPKHDTLTCTHIKIKKKKTKTHQQPKTSKQNPHEHPQS